MCGLGKRLPFVIVFKKVCRRFSQTGGQWRIGVLCALLHRSKYAVSGEILTIADR